jgi:drug/metabolite transporter (DMT)-like permease
MVACTLMSYILAASGFVAVQPLKSRAQFYKIASLALIFCFTVVLGNVSLRFIPVSFNQAIGATTPAFTAALSAVMLGHRESKEVYLSLVPVIIGIVIASGAEPLFNLAGFTAAILATAARALKSVMQGLMLSDSNEKMDSLSLLMYMAPVAAAALIPIALFFEPDAMEACISLGADRRFWALLLFNSALAYFVNLTNFLVTKHTSALTLQVLGNAKGVVAVVVSVLCFRNPVTFYSMLGYAITVMGVVFYSQAKKMARRTESTLILHVAGDRGRGKWIASASTGALGGRDDVEGGGGAYMVLDPAAAKQQRRGSPTPLLREEIKPPAGGNGRSNFMMNRGFSSVYET